MKIRALAAIAAVVLSACGGGMNSTPSGTTRTSGSKGVTISLIVPLAPKTTAGKRPSFVSPSTLGASLTISPAHGSPTTVTLDLSPAGGLCVTSGSQRTCNATVTAPFDTDTFAITLFDQAPVSGTIPGSAHPLAMGSTTQAITPTFSGSIAIFAGGLINSLGLSTTYSSASGDGTAQSVGVAIAPTDFGNNPITAGTNDPYANPITATLAETGATGHMHLVLNGTASGTTATLTKSSDALSIAYDGGGAVGYTTTVSLSASGAATQTFRVSPMFVTGSSTFFSGGILSLSGTASTVPLTVQEAMAPAGLSYTVGLVGCTNVATIGVVTQSGGVANFSATGGTTASSTGCTITISDGITTCIVDIVNTPVGSGVPLPGPSIVEYSAKAGTPPASPGAIAPGPDGRVWFADINNGGVGAMTTTGTVTSYVNSGHLYSGIVTGADGNLWATNANQVKIDKISSSGTVLAQFPTAMGATSITVGPDNNAWFTETSAGQGKVGSITPSGVVTEYSVGTSSPGAIVSAPDGTLWFCLTPGVVDYITTSGVVGSIATLAGTGCQSMAVGYDGNVWLSGNANGVIVLGASTHAVVATIPLTNASPSYSFIVKGVDQAMYVTDGNVIDRITTSAGTVVTPISMPTSSANAYGIALGVDGRIWFAENNVNQIGALSP